MNYQLNFDLLKLRGVKVVASKKTGKNLIVIPEEFVAVGKNGGAFVDFMAYELKETGRYGDTHMLKQRLKKDIYEAMSEDERKARPIAGNMKPYTPKLENPTGNGQGEPISADDMPF